MKKSFSVIYRILVFTILASVLILCSTARQIQVNDAYSSAPVTGSVLISGPELIVPASETEDTREEFYSASSVPSVSESAQRCSDYISPCGGVFNGVDSVTVSLSGANVYYTLDSTKPTVNSVVYSEPLILTETTVVRALIIDVFGTEHYVTEAYIINENHTIDVASIVCEPSDLFDNGHGIYTTGEFADDEVPHYGANYWNGNECESTVSLFAEDGGFSLPCGIRIFGGFSRTYPQKSFSVIFRSKYGASELNYPLFGDEGLDSYETFIFRASGQDTNRAHMRDAMITEILDDAGRQVFVQKNRPVALYLNGKYWGVYYIREKVNSAYVAGNCCVEKDSVTILQQNGRVVGENTGLINDDWRQLLNFVRSHDLSVDENYEEVKKSVDIESLVSFLAASFYVGNTDIGNYRWFCSPEYDNGRYNWLFYDSDWGMYDPYNDSVTAYLTDSVVYSAVLQQALLKNEDFRTRLLRETATQLNEIWSTENVTSYIDRYVAMLKPEIGRTCEKWGWYYDTWEYSVDTIRTFSEKRPAALYNRIKAYFQLTDEQMHEYGFSDYEE